MIVYLARDFPQFVMYCVNGKPRSSLFIESTDSMIYTREMRQPTRVTGSLRSQLYLKVQDWKPPTHAHSTRTFDVSQCLLHFHVLIAAESGKNKKRT